ncbi:16S ribosomal RNA methyltransferase RsmE [Metamycoplasma cloacale]|uniref:Ribosomal RNA small subunit methyltransferase E n=1 Tax=Metamycoplasma cloacale TaxID=92401 RepID=A0A2Z4LLU0_9BACT|nr:16S rRNA (uracil(1498)-N(3))-methyltransferase [Metamycoplasma cloacale]AWX42751.1 16S rRNA (uracil(1498)-N(3))-methyltransferase [Metamycoplasma cloacale]VEU79434.1 16S ribosomal RNA methyltransferase RsmE [Metamycoplasma cloacale]
MYKFFANKKENDCFILDSETLQHLKSVRIKPNEVFLVNYINEFYECNFIYPNLAKIIKKTTINNERDYQTTACLPLIKINHFELALQKLVELGVKKIIPFISEYTDQSNLKILNKRERFEKIIKEACQQSMRNVIPELTDVMRYDEILELNCKNKILAYEKAEGMPFYHNNEDVMLIVGPEGGFSLKEIDLAVKKNVKIVSLTKTILRAETALIFMFSRLN